jgi:hypothetical protein
MAMWAHHPGFEPRRCVALLNLARLRVETGAATAALGPARTALYLSRWAYGRESPITGRICSTCGHQNLLLEAPSRAFEIVVAEGLDRLSRDLAEVATLYKQLSYWGIGLVTVAEGPITDLHVGLKGTMNALYLKEIAQKTHRGLEGRVRNGTSGGESGTGSVSRRTQRVAAAGHAGTIPAAW